MTELLSVLRFAGTLLLVLVIFNFVILVHEWGHFLAARWRGLEIEKFQIWMGKPIWKKTYNGVQYGLGTVPIGGFVALPQMAPMEAIEGKCEDGTPRKKLPPIKPLDKIIVAFAGPLFSALLALFFACLVSLVGRPRHASETTTVIGYSYPDTPASRSDLRPGDRILKIDGREVTSFFGIIGSVQWAVASSKHNPITIEVERPGTVTPVTVKVDAPVGTGKQFEEWEKQSWWARLVGRPPLRTIGVRPALEQKVVSIIKDGPADKAGVKENDVIETVNGAKVWNSEVIHTASRFANGQPVNFTVKRGAEILSLSLTPQVPVIPGDRTDLEELKYPMPGLALGPLNAEDFTLTHPNPFVLVYDMAANSLSNLRAMLTPGTGIRAAHMSGPVGIMNLYYNVLQSPYALQLVFYMSVLLNMGLAVFNMMPLPVLDGGHITLATIEWIRGKSASLRLLEPLQTACVLLLLGFVCFVSVKDIGGLFGKKEQPFVETYSTPPAAP